jgi:ribonuclease E
MEISRQRRRTGILEGTTEVCPHCAGTGRQRTAASSALGALRALEVEAMRGGGEVVLRTSKETGLYILNHKRDALIRLAQSHGLFANVVLDEALSAAAHQIERVSSTPYERPDALVAEPDTAEQNFDDDFEIEEEEEDDLPAEAEPLVEAVANEDDGPRRGRRRRRGRRPDAPAESAPSVEGAGEGQGRRRRGRRGGRRTRETSGDAYGWSWPARLSGEDPYEWRGPVERDPSAAPVLRTEPQLPAGQPSALPEPEPALVLAAVEPAPAVEDEVWVELPEPALPKAAKPRRRRGRSEPPVETQAETAVIEEAATSEPSPPIVQPALAEILPEAPPVTLAVDNPPPAESDPAEIVDPPSTPRRGWWRRSV